MIELPKKAIAAALALILTAVFAAEGGYVNDPRDPGGETNHGITKRVAVANGYTGPMRDLTKDRSRQIYVLQYIEAPGYLPIVDRDMASAEEIVDSGVNAGPGRASRWLQQSLNLLNDGGRDCRRRPAAMRAQWQDR